MLSLVFGKVDAQTADGFLDFLDFNGNRLGEFLLVFDDLINEKLQFPYQIDGKYQGKTFIRYEFKHVLNIQSIAFLSKSFFLRTGYPDAESFPFHKSRYR